MMTNTRLPPTFIMPPDVSSMSEHEVDTLLKDMRDARLMAVRVYEEKMEMKRQVSEERLREQIGKQLEMLNKALVRWDEMETKIRDRVNKIRALELQVEDL